jgi:hypothetical protein
MWWQGIKVLLLVTGSPKNNLRNFFKKSAIITDTQGKMTMDAAQNSNLNGNEYY